jgi:hypothetical protein
MSSDQKLLELKELVKTFFDEYLDSVDESESGREFHPIQVSCCRALKSQPLGELLRKMKELSR